VDNFDITQDFHFPQCIYIMLQFTLKYNVIQCKGTKIDLSVMFLFIEHNALHFPKVSLSKSCNWYLLEYLYSYCTIYANIDRCI